MGDPIFKVVIHFAAEYGQVEFDAVNKTVRVTLSDAVKKTAVEKYLSEPHVIQNADGNDLYTFHAKSLVPTESLESFKLALTRLWHHTGIYVDWSRPTV
ncbi:MAG TPA: hypothetical protein VN631_13025 [Negativicutes bacterium]|nr:hypothetical protein [Negativicutes bacterium]